VPHAAACSLALPAACPGSRDLRGCGAVRRAGCYSFSGRMSRPSTSPQGTPPLRAESLGCHKESSMDTQAIRAQMPTLGSRPRAFQRPQRSSSTSSTASPRFRRWAFTSIPSLRGQGHRHHRRGHRRQDGAGRVRGARQALVTDVPDEGAKVQVEPYARRRFDGCARTRPRSRPSSPPTASRTR
jgi:hypothetical protein